MHRVSLLLLRLVIVHIICPLTGGKKHAIVIVFCYSRHCEVFQLDKFSTMIQKGTIEWSPDEANPLTSANDMGVARANHNLRYIFLTSQTPRIPDTHRDPSSLKRSLSVHFASLAAAAVVLVPLSVLLPTAAFLLNINRSCLRYVE